MLSFISLTLSLSKCQNSGYERGPSHSNVKFKRMASFAKALRFSSVQSFCCPCWENWFTDRFWRNRPQKEQYKSTKKQCTTATKKHNPALKKKEKTLKCIFFLKHKVLKVKVQIYFYCFYTSQKHNWSKKEQLCFKNEQTKQSVLFFNHFKHHLHILGNKCYFIL